MMEKQELSLVHQILFPEEPIEKPPLLLMLHGYGSHENDLFATAPMLNEKCTVVSLRAPITLPQGGFAWYEIDFNALGTGRMSNVEQAKESREKIRRFIAEAHEAYGTDPEKVWLLGFSQGAILSYGLSLGYPKEFSRVMALSGYVLKELVPETYRPEDIRHLEFFASHGTSDDVLPVEWARQTMKMLEELKISHQYREYPIGHGINHEGFADMKVWMRDREMVK